MMTTDERIEQYKKAYFSYHKRYPDIRKNGAWIYINNSPTAHRSSDLPRMALNLIEMATEEIDFTKKEPEYFEVKYSIIKKWKKDIPDHVIVMFLDDLHRKCQNSTFRMERFMKNFVTGGDLSDCDFGGNIFECDPDNCEFADSLEHDLDIKDRKISSLKEDVADRESEIKAIKRTIQELKDELDEINTKYDHLKENSVLFSMNDLKDYIIPEYSDIDDDIPF